MARSHRLDHNPRRLPPLLLFCRVPRRSEVHGARSVSCLRGRVAYGLGLGLGYRARARAGAGVDEVLGRASHAEVEVDDA